MCPKARSDNVSTVRIELQQTERDALEALVTQAQLVTTSQTLENMTDSFSNLTKPFFGSGDSGILLTYLTSTILDDLVVPDDNALDLLVNTETGQVIRKKVESWVFDLWGIDERWQDMYWADATKKQKSEAAPTTQAISDILKTTKYITGIYLSAKVGADVLEAIIPL